MYFRRTLMYLIHSVKNWVDIRTLSQYIAFMEIDGEAVRIVRERMLRVTSADLAAALGISASYLRDIETGIRTLSRNQALIERIAQVCDVPIRMIARKVPE